MSVSSSKTIVTDEMPNFETLRSSVTSGRPASAFSTRLVTSRSTSSGERPGALVSTMHLRIGHVRDGVDRNLQRAIHAADRQQAEQRDHQEAIAEREVDEGGQHGEQPGVQESGVRSQESGVRGRDNGED